MNIRQKKLPIATLERIDDLCAEFEMRWQADQPPAIESVIQDDLADVERGVLLAELIVLEIDYRRRRGETPTQDDYLNRFPEQAEAIREALQEGVKRSGAFVPPALERIAELFPALDIIELLGAGGMGAVYKTRQKGLDRIVALKILPEEFGHDVKFALRFTREARTLARLNHPNIVSVYEFGNVDDMYYFLMEYVDGPTLREVVSSKELVPEHALAIVPHLCDALQFAHDKGIIHRDIKPENILMTTDGSVKIADFGLSRLLEGDQQETALTGTHQVMGTLRYMAPEQMEGARGVDHRADIYSLGVVFYEMLTGELPIGRFEVPSQKVNIDVRLDEVVLRTLEKEPQRRYQAASEIKSDMQSIASSASPSLAPTMVHDVHRSGVRTETVSSVESQERAGRLLLTRYELMRRVEDSLRPLFRYQILQIFFGIALIVLGALCWGPNVAIPHLLVCGLIVHVYGLVVLGTAANVLTKINRIDYSKSVDEIRGKIDEVRTAYMRNGHVVGFAWWLMWIPVFVAFGFEAVLLPNPLYLSLAIGVIGLIVSEFFYVRLLRGNRETSEKWRAQFAGRSITAAYRSLNDIEQAQIA